MWTLPASSMGSQIAVQQRFDRPRVDTSTSMADDLSAGRPTEIAWLCGEVDRLAQSVGLQAPLNARMQALVEASPQRGAPYSPRQLAEALGV